MKHGRWLFVWCVFNLTAIGTLFSQGADVPAAIAIAPDNMIYVTGSSMDSAGMIGFYTVSYDAQGTVRGWQRFSHAASRAAIPSSITFNGSDVLVTGTAPTLQAGYDIVAVSYPRTMLVSVRAMEYPRQLQLEQSFPNPVSSEREAVISYSIPVATHARLAVIDMTGKEIAVIIDGFKEEGRYSVTFQPAALPPGTYYYVLTASERAETRRMVVFR